MFTDEEVGARIAQVREANGWKQVSIAIALKLPRSRASEIESGRRKLRFSEAIELAKIFDVPLERLVPREEP
jgi:transcriptional regulator with XRE-family HTH domain